MPRWSLVQSELRTQLVYTIACHGIFTMDRDILQSEDNDNTALFYVRPGKVSDPFSKNLPQIERTVIPDLFWAVAFPWPVTEMTGNRGKAAHVLSSDFSWGQGWLGLCYTGFLVCVTSVWSIWLRGKIALCGPAGVTASASQGYSREPSDHHWQTEAHSQPAYGCVGLLSSLSLVWSRSYSSLWFRGFPLCRHPLWGVWTLCMSSPCILPMPWSFEKMSYLWDRNPPGAWCRCHITFGGHTGEEGCISI